MSRVIYFALSSLAPQQQLSRFISKTRNHEWDSATRVTCRAGGRECSGHPNVVLMDISSSLRRFRTIICGTLARMPLELSLIPLVFLEGRGQTGENAMKFELRRRDSQCERS